MTQINTLKTSNKSSTVYCNHQFAEWLVCEEFSLEKCNKCQLIKTINKLKTLKEYSDTALIS